MAEEEEEEEEEEEAAASRGEPASSGASNAQPRPDARPTAPPLWDKGEDSSEEDQVFDDEGSDED